VAGALAATSAAGWTSLGTNKLGEIAKTGDPSEGKGEESKEGGVGEV